MPVQINEVIIRAVVDNGATSGSPSVPSASPNTTSSDSEIAALVLEIMKEKNER